METKIHLFDGHGSPTPHWYQHLKVETMRIGRTWAQFKYEAHEVERSCGQGKAFQGHTGLPHGGPPPGPCAEGWAIAQQPNNDLSFDDGYDGDSEDQDDEAADEAPWDSNSSATAVAGGEDEASGTESDDEPVDNLPASQKVDLAMVMTIVPHARHPSLVHNIVIPPPPQPVDDESDEEEEEEPDEELFPTDNEMPYVQSRSEMAKPWVEREMIACNDIDATSDISDGNFVTAYSYSSDGENETSADEYTDDYTAWDSEESADTFLDRYFRKRAEEESARRALNKVNPSEDLADDKEPVKVAANDVEDEAKKQMYEDEDEEVSEEEDDTYEEANETYEDKDDGDEQVDGYEDEDEEDDETYRDEDEEESSTSEEISTQLSTIAASGLNTANIDTREPMPPARTTYYHSVAIPRDRPAVVEAGPSRRTQATRATAPANAIPLASAFPSRLRQSSSLSMVTRTPSISRASFDFAFTFSVPSTAKNAPRQA